MYSGETTLLGRCSDCGKDNPGDSAFCGGCGQRLEGPPPDLSETAEALDQGRILADQHERPDLSEHLADTQARLSNQILGVVVVGEYKRGKSSLVNALLQTEICPVDADVATAVPMFVHHSGTLSCSANFSVTRPGQDEPALDQEPVDVDHIPEFVEGTRAPGDGPRLHSIEVGLPNRLLEGGLCLIDTPGVGGLESTHGALTMGALGNACGMVFVTDASQELTAPEMAFLREALARTSNAVCVVTKTDIYPHWRTIVDLNRKHLADRGVTIPVLPVSSFLEQRSGQEHQTEDESGFGGLFGWLRTEVTEPAAAQVVSAAQRDLSFVREQLSQEIAAEQRVLQAPEHSPEVVEQLQESSDRARRLMRSDSSWQQQLTDGMEDLIADVRHDLDEQMRSLTGRANSMIDRTDPDENWPTMEAWLHRQVVLVATANHDLLERRAGELSAEVAGSFEEESGASLQLGLAAPADLLRGLHLDQVESPLGEPIVARALAFARTAGMVPSLLLPVISVTSGLSVSLILGPLSLMLGAIVGEKVLRDSHERQVHKRREEAKVACKRFLDEAAFVVGKDCMDSLRRTGRELRDEFRTRAEVMHETSQRALNSVERASTLEPEQRRRRAAQLVGDRQDLDALNRPKAAR